ncbi:MAG: GIY-YIG nuclease family protein, partial [Bacteroidetes bacterium]|nr:GIY-YIG nuclease family protein [Bacteroidota bacterium]
TYILYSEKLNKYYIGACTDVEKRLFEHNSALSKFTSRGIPWKLMYREFFESFNEALQREREIKKKKSRKYIEYIIATKL